MSEFVMGSSSLQQLMSDPNTSSDEVGIDLHYRGVRRIAGLDAYASTLRSLDLSFNEITTIENVSHLTNLRELKLYHNDLERVENLEGLESLEQLYLHDNGAVELAFPLRRLRSLKELRLDSNRFSSLASLNGCKALTSLDLSKNKLTSLTGLGTLPSLTQLLLNHNELVDLDGVCSLPKLRELSLDHNHIASLDCVLRFKALGVLRVGNNRLVSLATKGVGSLANLSELYLPSNRLERARELRSLCRNIDVLDLSNNRLEVAQLGDMARLPMLADLHLAGNPVAHELGYRAAVVARANQLETLDGIDVTPSEHTANADVGGGEESKLGGGEESKLGSEPDPVPAVAPEPPQPSMLSPRQRREVGISSGLAWRRPPRLDGGGGGVPVMRPLSARTGRGERIGGSSRRDAESLRKEVFREEAKFKASLQAFRARLDSAEAAYKRAAASRRGDGGPRAHGNSARCSAPISCRSDSRASSSTVSSGGNPPPDDVDALSVASSERPMSAGAIVAAYTRGAPIASAAIRLEDAKSSAGSNVAPPPRAMRSRRQSLQQALSYSRQLTLEEDATSESSEGKVEKSTAGVGSENGDSLQGVESDPGSDRPQSACSQRSGAKPTTSTGPACEVDNDAASVTSGIENTPRVNGGGVVKLKTAERRGKPTAAERRGLRRFRVPASGTVVNNC